MTKKIIAFDIDDVLAASAEGFAKFSNDRWGTSLTADDYDEHWAKVWQVDNTEVERRANEFHNSGVVRSYGYFDEAESVLRDLAKDHELVVVTSRRQQMTDDTNYWIAKHFPDIFSQVNFAGIWDDIDDDTHNKTKADICMRLGADYLVDDQLKHCNAVANCGKKALLFGDYPWNQSDDLPENVTRVRDWADVAEYFRV